MKFDVKEAVRRINKAQKAGIFIIACTVEDREKAIKALKKHEAISYTLTEELIEKWKGMGLTVIYWHLDEQYRIQLREYYDKLTTRLIKAQRISNRIADILMLSCIVYTVVSIMIGVLK